MTNSVWVVRKNADFTEGRGPMLIHAIFENDTLAVEYIMTKPGIYGRRQEEGRSFASTKTRNFNGYDLTEWVVQDTVKTQREIEELKSQEAALKEKLDAIRHELAQSGF